MKAILVSFFDRAFAPVRLPVRSCLAEHLDVTNSPLLFGCRTGICGTCLIRVEGDVPPPGDEERELLDVLAPGDPQARLACQVELTCDVCVEPHPEGPTGHPARSGFVVSRGPFGPGAA